MLYETSKLSMVVEAHLCESEGIKTISCARCEGIGVLIELVSNLNPDCSLEIHRMVVAGGKFVALISAARLGERRSQQTCPSMTTSLAP